MTKATEKEKLQMKDWRKNNPDKVKETNKNRYKNPKNPNRKEYIRNYMKDWRKKNPEKCKIQEQKRNRLRNNDHDKVIDLLGGKCVSHMKNFGCECTDKRLLQINHINNDGHKERKEKSYTVFHKEILNGKRKTDDLDIRCANCNILYKYEIICL
jgi:hypothetical protein